MRLGDMNNITAEKLNEDMAARVGWNFGDLSRLSTAQASAMLEAVDSKLEVYKTSSKLHESEKSTTYNGLMLAKQVLETFISEDNNPYAMGHLDMDESEAQGVMEDEVGQAESLMAAQDMVDSIQGMLEDVGEMINEKLPPLADSLRRSNGADAAAAFNQQTNDALNALMDAVRGAREAMAGAVGTLTGDQPTPMTSAGDDADFAASDDVDFDAEPDVDLDDFEASDAATGGDEPLGRSKRS